MFRIRCIGLPEHATDLRSPLALVSGGPDSVALLRVVIALGGEPVILHVDHGLRGEGSRGQDAANYVIG